MVSAFSSSCSSGETGSGIVSAKPGDYSVEGKLCTLKGGGVGVADGGQQRWQKAAQTGC